MKIVRNLERNARIAENGRSITTDLSPEAMEFFCGTFLGMSYADVRIWSWKIALQKNIYGRAEIASYLQSAAEYAKVLGL